MLLAESTWRTVRTRPAPRNSCMISAASSVESSTSRTCKSIFCSPRLSGLDRQRLIQGVPEAAPQPRGAEDIRKSHRLAQIAVGTQAISFNDIRLLHGRGENHDGRRTRVPAGAQVARVLQAGDFRQFQLSAHARAMSFPPLRNGAQSHRLHPDQRIQFAKLRPFTTVACRLDVVPDLLTWLGVARAVWRNYWKCLLRTQDT